MNRDNSYMKTEEYRKKVSEGIRKSFKNGRVVWNKKNRITKKCECCEKDFEIIDSDFGKKQKCCSKQCKYDSQKGKTTWNAGMKGKGLYKLWDNKKNPMSGTHPSKELIEKRTKHMKNKKFAKSFSNKGIMAQRHKRTSIEKIMKEMLIEEELTFIEQKYISGYFVDFLLTEFNVVIECDGNYWHNYPEGLEYDRLRDKKIENNGYIVIRFWETDIKNNIYQVKRDVRSKIKQLHNIKEVCINV